MRFCEFQDKEVINVCSCRKLGYVADLLFDECTGRIESIIVPKGGKFCGLFTEASEYTIPYECIKKIGSDIILVEIRELS